MVSKRRLSDEVGSLPIRDDRPADVILGRLDLVAVERVHVYRALEGWRRFGRGRHPAALNPGDLFAYALAVTSGYPVLCTGADFGATDVAVARPGVSGPA